LHKLIYKISLLYAYKKNTSWSKEELLTGEFLIEY